MAKNSIRDYSATNSSNTDIQSIDISEGCSPAGINNAIREVMADLKDVSTGAVALESPAADSLTVTGDLTVDTNTLYVDSTNNRVGIGTSSPVRALHVDSSSNLVGRFSSSATEGFIQLAGSGTSTAPRVGATGNNLIVYTNDAERLRIDSSGNLLVGRTTNAGYSANSVALSAVSGNGSIFDGTGNTVAFFNRRTSDGDILNFSKDGSTVGSIGIVSGKLTINSQGSNLSYATGGVVRMNNDSSQFYSNTDNTMNLGIGSLRWNTLFASNGTINTSDANEKQQITSLTDAEITAAKAISALFKTYKWNDAVAAKGDAARTHTGVIAQDVEAAMTAAGLDAADYAFWCSDTWWETQTEVPAVEAVEAVLDEDGNVVTEAVEAVAAYTRTDTYETAEEAPEGATERTRLGIRYPELLAFVGAATEQRLANIETRLAALEAN